jgi:hypothetical protein
VSAANVIEITDRVFDAAGGDTTSDQDTYWIGVRE